MGGEEEGTGSAEYVDADDGEAAMRLQVLRLQQRIKAEGVAAVAAEKERELQRTASSATQHQAGDSCADVEEQTSGRDDAISMAGDGMDRSRVLSVDEAPPAAAVEAHEQQSQQQQQQHKGKPSKLGKPGKDVKVHFSMAEDLTPSGKAGRTARSREATREAAVLREKALNTKPASPQFDYQQYVGRERDRETETDRDTETQRHRDTETQTQRHRDTETETMTQQLDQSVYCGIVHMTNYRFYTTHSLPVRLPLFSTHISHRQVGTDRVYAWKDGARLTVAPATSGQVRAPGRRDGGRAMWGREEADGGRSGRSGRGGRGGRGGGGPVGFE